MVSYKDSAKRVTSPKRTIKVDNVRVEGGKLTDEAGDIVEAIAESLPDGVEEFTIRIQVDLPGDEEEA